MSVRIHVIAKEIKKTSKELLEILAERGYELKSAYSTIDNITAESLIEEFKSDGHKSTDSEASDSEKSTSDRQTDVKPSNIPLVKSKDDIEREKREQEAAELAVRESQNLDTISNQEERDHSPLRISWA